jgi:class 3 adenylate cyclase
MDPQIRYVKSADGTTLAAATLGSGPLLVLLPSTQAVTIETWWAIPESRASLEGLAARFTVVLFDLRGAGLSDREVEDFSLDARVADIEAVFAGLASGPAFLVARSLGCPQAISFAARHPELVRRLALVTPIARGRDWHQTLRRRAIEELFAVDYDLYWQCMALVVFGAKEAALQYGLRAPKAVSADVMTRAFAQLRQHDATDALTAIRCPTLVVGTRADDSPIALDVMRRVAAAIPGARFRTNEGQFSDSQLLVGSDANFEAVVAFFDDELRAPDDTSPLPEGMTVILFADIVDSTSLTEQLGDAAFRERAAKLDIAMRTAIGEAGGTTVEGKLVGDGVMAVFRSARQALDGALRCREAAATSGLSLHLGLHAGDVIREKDNVFGGAVNIASRISALSAPGEVLVSDIVRGLARTSAGVTFEDRGEQALKGVADPVRMFAVCAQDGG